MQDKVEKALDYLENFEGKSEAEKSLKEDVEYNLVINKVKSYMLQHGYKSFGIIRVPSQLHYYEQSLEWRREFISAPSKDHLCKSIVMENTSFDSAFQSPHYQQFYCVIIQYTTKINSDKLMKLGRQIQNESASKESRLGKKAFHFRLVPEETSFQLTGYRHNAVTPFAMTEKMPMILSDSIATLQPGYFYLGGGAIDLKIRVAIQALLTLYESTVHIGDIVYK